MLIVMMGVVFGVQYWRMRTNPTPPANAPAVTTYLGNNRCQRMAVAVPGSREVSDDRGGGPVPPAVQAASAESATVVENELYRITFSNRGGQVTSWILKRYKDEDGKPLELVDRPASAKFGYPMSLYTYDAGLTQTLANAMFVPSATGALAAPATLSFHYAANGLDVTKTFNFGQDYLIHADTQVLQDGNPVPRCSRQGVPLRLLGDVAVVRTRSGHSYPSDSSARFDHAIFCCRTARTSTSLRRRSRGEQRSTARSTSRA